VSTTGIEFANIACDGRALKLEYRWITRELSAAPLIVFLHEGLGSVALWRDFPDTLCAAAKCRGLVYSRPGYGRSTPRAKDEHWTPDFLELQATDVLPAFLKTVGIDVQGDRPCLFGHSDGGSIALLHGARFPDAVTGLIVLAPHIFVEDLSVASIASAREAYLTTDLRSKLARFHDDVDSAFWGWNEVWLDPRFRSWSIEAQLAAIHCPVLAVQGVDDEYGTMAQIDGIQARAPQTELLKLEACGHSPHRDQAERVIAAAVEFMRRQQASR
jgi:pimeloyl-ACP methyl ester carboxylesterase